MHCSDRFYALFQDLSVPGDVVGVEPSTLPEVRLAPTQQTSAHTVSDSVSGEQPSATPDLSPAPTNSGDLVYADVGTALRNRGQGLPARIPEDRLVYAQVDTRATAALQKENEGSSITLCMQLSADLRRLIILSYCSR